LIVLIGPVLYFGCQSVRGTTAGQEIVLSDPEGHARAKISASSLEFFDARGERLSSLTGVGLDFTYKESHATFSPALIEFGNKDTKFLVTGAILTYGHGWGTFSLIPSEEGMSLTTRMKESQFGGLVQEGSASMFAASPQGGEIDITADQTGTRIDRSRTPGH
jgi:hypothetical protein